MRTTRAALVCLLLLACTTTTTSPPAAPPPPVQDAVIGLPENYTVLLENEYVRAVKHRLPPRGREPMHSHPYPRVVYPVNASRIRVWNGQPREVQSSPSQVFFREPQVHAIENLGDEEAVFIMAELRKSEPERRSVPQLDDGTIVAPDVYPILLENDRVRVIEVRTRPGLKTPMHSHPGLAFRYRLVPTRSRITLPDGRVVESDNPAGAAIWTEDPSQHILENIGVTESRTLLVEIK